jgi:predicted HicB family RNase H-like nuclease
MNNVMRINDQQAVISYDPEIEMFRGEFIGLNGGADFYATDTEGLKREGAISLKVFLEMCAADGVEPCKTYSGKFMLRLDAQTHAAAVVAAAAQGQSLNQWATETLRHAVAH